MNEGEGIGATNVVAASNEQKRATPAEAGSKPASSPHSPPHPPKPPLVFHVGVTGHRPDPQKRPDPDVVKIREAARKVLGTIHDAVHGIAHAQRDTFLGSGDAGNGPVEPRLRILSSLAAGGDQWVTEEALSLKYELQAVLPFSRAEYAADFEDVGARNNFTRLLEDGEHPPVVFELDGMRDKRSLSYLAAGRQILQQADILVAVWDGKDERGVGGTGQIVREALENGVPVVRIQWIPKPRENWDVLLSPVWNLVEGQADREDDTPRLKKTVAEILLPPDCCPGHAHQDPDSLRDAYFTEKERTRTWLGGFWEFFLGTVVPQRNKESGRLERPKWGTRVRIFHEATEKPGNGDVQGQNADKSPHEEPPELKEQPASDEWKALVSHYLPHYAWANGLSRFYGGLHRSFFVLTFLLGALAVGLALAGGWVLMAEGPDSILIFLEFVVIVAILVLAWRSRKGRWHVRWLEYRTLAERLRVSRPMALAGGWRQQASMPGHLACYGDPVNSWVYWLCRAVERAVGLPNARLDTARLRRIQSAFHALGDRQIRYHGKWEKRFGIADRRLHRIADGLFQATLFLCAGHLVVEWCFPGSMPAWLKTFVIGLNAFLPACAAALAAIRNQGEFQRLARRSEAMHRALTALRQELAMIAPKDAALKSLEIRHVIERIARLMLNETLDWRIVFQDRPPGLPA